MHMGWAPAARGCYRPLLQLPTPQLSTRTTRFIAVLRKSPFVGHTEAVSRQRGKRGGEIDRSIEPPGNQAGCRTGPDDPLKRPRRSLVGGTATQGSAAGAS